MSTFWDVLWFICITYLFVAYLMALFHVLGDLFRNEKMGGFAKALWTIGLIFVPILSLLLYFVVHGRAMAERATEYMIAAKASQDAYIREVAQAAPAGGGASPVEQVAQAKALLDAGAISPEEFQAIKASALSGAIAPAASRSSRSSVNAG
ncbi:SHOCT domain-containing protein [Cellulomonas sp. S1-8]|uniref:SHOCT domain-containing protein n=1 Tax=Cellulomonas sp. S1-8 TaxID=2904790 RepID=UPI002242FF21|nr:SHOCT domain-containing protein [Cellulomonas sp. S1-8]UZN03679.1 SHOCT domain-containing protein [Cellulomonas sp. S1-8]